MQSCGGQPAASDSGTRRRLSTGANLHCDDVGVLHAWCAEESANAVQERPHTSEGRRVSQTNNNSGGLEEWRDSRAQDAAANFAPFVLGWGKTACSLRMLLQAIHCYEPALADSIAWCVMAHVRDSLESRAYSSLGQLRIHKRIARNRNSTCFKAVSTVNRKHVMLKKIEIFDGRMTQADRRACLEEQRMLQQVRHPNLIRQYTSFIEDNSLCCVQLLVDGACLARMIKHFKKNKRLIPEKTVWKYFAQVCAGVGRLHHSGIAHRDIVPRKVLITTEGLVKLSAPQSEAREPQRRALSSKRHSGEPLDPSLTYISPERMHGSSVGPGLEADVWSLGCLLYEMAALQAPFDGKLSLYLLCKRIEACEYPLLPATHYSHELRHLVQQCLVAEPAQRPTIRHVCSVARQQHKKYNKASQMAAGQRRQRQPSLGTERDGM